MKQTIDQTAFAWFKGVPEHTRGSILRYLNHGMDPGGFVRAALANDFIAAACKADAENRQALTDIARFIATGMPRGSWGSYEAVDGWLHGNEYRKEYEEALMMDVLSGVTSV
jgi:hypothetical protein